MSTIVCPTCPNFCKLEQGEIGICGARKAIDGKVKCINYGLTTSLALDPIEKKPLNRFYPGSLILSTGSFGCNLACPFCQNHSIATGRIDNIAYEYTSPQKLVDYALTLKRKGNIGIAYTYNEPLVGWEYVLDCAELAHKQGLVNVLVTNGYINPAPLKQLLPYIDAANIDLKSFSEEFYKKIGGNLQTVKNTIATAYPHWHIEVTTLVIPDENDSVQEMEQLVDWLASLGQDIPLHINRFYPRFKYANRQPTPIATLQQLAELAKAKLKYVYLGNC